MTPDVLLVDPRPHFLRRLQIGWGDLVSVRICSEFRGARRILLDEPPSLLITNLRLHSYNGLHLVYLAGLLDCGTRSIVFSDTPEAWFLREIRVAGAFFERPATLPTALPAYIGALLPAHDRRDPRVFDRRQAWRGGRRSIDNASLADLPVAHDLPGLVGDAD